MKDYSSELIFEKSKKGRVGFSLPDLDCPEINIKNVVNPALLREDNLDLPEVSEPEIIRHFTNLSTKNHHIDKGFYPLGSCTMKYNPKINDMIAGFDDLKNVHPLQNPSTAQGCLEIMYNLEKILKAINLQYSIEGIDVDQPKSYKKCPSTHLRTTIAPSGTFICPYWRGKDDYNIGDLNKMTFKEMWDGVKRKEVMDRVDISVDCHDIHCLRHETNNTCIDLKNKLDNNVKISTTSEFDRFI